MKVATKLYLGFGALIMIMTGLLIFSVINLNKISQNTEDLYENPFTVSAAVLRVDSNIAKMQGAMEDLVSAETDEDIDAALAVVKFHEDAVYEDIKIIRERFLGDISKVDEFETLFMKWKPIREVEINLIKHEEREKAAMIMKAEGAEHVKKLENTVNELKSYTQERADFFYKDSVTINQRTSRALYALIIITTVIAIFLSTYTARSISKPIRKLHEGAEMIGKGNMAHKIDIKSKDEFEELATAFNKMTADLKKFHAGLEKQVEERTKDIRKKTLELEESNKSLEDARLATMNILEDVQETNEKLKEIDKLKTDFLNTTSHELKTPLTPIRSYLDLLEDESLGKLDPQQKVALKVIDNNMTRLRRLIDDILDITKVEAGKMKFFMEKLKIRKLIQESITNQKPFADEKGIKIISLVPERLPLVEGDKQRLFQVLTNLIDNAIKFSPKKSKITIKAEKRKNGIQLAVTDQGIGVSKEDQKKLFTKFFQADTSATREQPGTGLGLPICKGIIKAHHGKIWAESKLGKGSTFYFTLPLKQPKPAKIPEEELPQKKR